MSASRKGKRQIVVGGVRHYWQSRGTDYDGIIVSVATDDAFVPGQRGQWLHFVVPYDSLVVARDRGWSLHQRSAVTPGLVRRAIELARRGAPPFTGRAGEPDIVLTEAGVDEARGETPLARIEADLGRAGKLLARIAEAARDPARDIGDACEVLLGYFFAMSIQLSRSPEIGRPPAIDAWLHRAADLLERLAPHFQACVRGIEEMLTRPREPWEGAWERCCERRSAVAFFLDHCRHAGLDDLAARLDTRRLDARLDAPRAGEGREGIRAIPTGIPVSHWWWRVPSPSNVERR